MTAGIPIRMINFLSNPCLNKAIFAMLLERWNNAVMPSTEWKSKKKLAIGTKNKEDPNPPTVPNTSARSANKIK